ncbi:MAG: symmetrical bis(5'-nucleosyl)-tetraphosphatase [Burkholderiaceae bacterium]|nr:MAG: symmetrical bis(5'-nucleosyl)-tetraphosphatase [Burkholderiaceae bacterium]
MGTSFYAAFHLPNTVSTYVIGDIQGCCNPLDALLHKIAFDASRDRLWLVGDLVNRGHESLAVLRQLKALGDAVTAVLGNHDLHLLAVAEGLAKRGKHDTLDAILAAPDCAELLFWLRQQKLAHFDRGVLLVHAGVLPQWDVATTLRLAGEVEHMLRGPDYRDFLGQMYGNQPDHWRDDLSGVPRLRMITNALTRLRFCTADGVMEFDTKYGAEDAPPGYLPWFDVPGRATRAVRVAFGHWSTLGLRVEEKLLALDTGCVWGGQLTAVRLEDDAVFQVNCAAAQIPGSLK